MMTVDLAFFNNMVNNICLPLVYILVRICLCVEVNYTHNYHL